MKATRSKVVVPEKKETSLASVDAGALIQRAIDKGLPLEQMERLLAMRRELKTEWAREQFFKALSKFQQECPVIKKSAAVDFEGRNGGRVKYNYAPLDEIVFQVKDLLEKHGFSYTIKPIQTADLVTSVCEAHHVDGHTETTPFSVPVDHGAKMNSAQQVASAMTYSKRYAFCNAFGIMTGDADDDAQSVGMRSKEAEDATPAVYDVGPKKEAKPPVPEEQIIKATRLGVARSDLNDIFKKLKASKLFTDAEIDEKSAEAVAAKDNTDSLLDLGVAWVDEMNARKRGEQ